jgi:arylformamidase
MRYSSQAELDAQFTLDRITDLDSVFARRAKEAEACLARFEVKRNIPYGVADAETLNLFPAPGGSGPAPVLVFVHGGFWRSMEAVQFSFLAPGFVPFGASLAIIDYPLIPQVRLDEIVAACRRAVAWVWQHGRTFGLDPDRIFVSGNSAGGHLVAELLDRAWTGAMQLPADVIKGGTAISGLYDLEPVAASFQNDTLQLTNREIETLSPLRRRLEVKAPAIVAVGGEETEEFLVQSAEFAAHLSRNGAEALNMVVPETDHITVVLDGLAKPGAELNRAVRRQMGLALGLA